MKFIIKINEYTKSKLMLMLSISVTTQTTCCYNPPGKAAVITALYIWHSFPEFRDLEITL